MKNLYRRLKWLNTLIATIILFTICQNYCFAQQALEGVVRIKVSESLAIQLESKKFSKTLTGDVVTGISSLDQVNRQYKVNRFTRVFRHAGKNEVRHRKYGLHLWYEVNMDKGSSVSQLINSYRADKQIIKAEPVYQKELIGSDNKNFGPVIQDEISNAENLILPAGSNDPFLSKQWHYNNTGQTGGTPGADIKLFNAWQLETGQKEIVIAVTDGGIQTNHEDLAANMWVNTGEVPGNNIDDDNNGFTDDIHGYSFVDDTGTIVPQNHATHVAGTIAAVSNNGIGVAGVAGGSGSGDGIRLMSCAVFNDMSSDGFPESYIYGADNGAVISQNSWSYTFPGIYEQAVLEAIDYFISEAGKDANGLQVGPMSGGIVIFSAGNDNDDDNYFPGFYEPVLTVAATTHKDKKALYSNFGSWVDISAPGGETYQSVSQGVFSTLAGNKYGSFMGTSMACPHVSGVAGLIVSKFGKAGFRPEALRERLRHSVNNINALNSGYAGKLGTGRVNATLALTQNDNTAPQPINDLSVANIDIGEITVTWTTPNDNSGFISGYDIRYSTSPITTSNFTSAKSAPDVPTPKPTGSTEAFTIGGLPGGTLYYFAIKSMDFEGNISAISNVVSETSAFTPTIVISPATITENLKTAETSTRTFTISNAGLGPLEFLIGPSDDENDIASVAPLEGVITPGDNQIITVSFDATGLLTGTYQQDITIQNNDPEHSTVTVPLTLIVVNNNAPIASLKPTSINFKSVQIGTTLSRPVTITNAGSDPLIIDEIVSTNQVFGADFSGNITIDAFADEVINLTFSPASTGSSTGNISIHTNDPANGILNVAVQGEGLNEPPVVASPNSFAESLDQGTTTTRTFMLRNNGSHDRAFRMEVANTGVATGTSAARSRQGRIAMAIPSDSTTAQLARRREKHEAQLSVKPSSVKALLKAISPSNGETPSKNINGRKALAAADSIRQYVTGFENFTLGPFKDQEDWFHTQGWTVSSDNPDKGVKHLRGTSVVSGEGEKFAISPFLFESDFYPQYTTTSMRINLDHAKGTSWQVVPQDPWSFIATRIRFNADGSIDGGVIDSNYDFHWKRLPVNTPVGYFDLAIEYNSWGSDTSSFPTYHLFINNQHVFSGTGLAPGIGQVAIVSTMETSGPTLDIDNFYLSGSEFIPAFIKPSPNEGTLPAGESLEISLEFDASVMKFGSYQSDLIVHLDETDSLIVPTTLTVTGEASLVQDLYYLHLEANKGETASQEITLTNTGGRPIQYNFDFDLPGLTVTPDEGTIRVRENKIIAVKFDGIPGVYLDKIVLRTDIEHDPMREIPVEVVMFDSGAVFYAPSEVHFDITAGEITTRNIQIRNDGINTVSFRTVFLADHLPWVSFDPSEATVSNVPLDFTMTFDAREVSAGAYALPVVFRTNDINQRIHGMFLTLNVLPDTIRSGKIVREEWTGIQGTDISSIPVETPPSSTSIRTMFEGPTNAGDNYGARIRGYIRAPFSGYYTFWISSDDNSELWLSLDDSAAHKVKIAFVTGFTAQAQWDKYESQKSEAIYLEAHGKYYIEALHKEGVDADNLAVGWALPNQTFERPIPGWRLIPFGMEVTNESPKVSILTPTTGEIFSPPATIEITADASDDDGSVLKVEFYNGAVKLGIDRSAPYAFSWKNVESGDYTLIVKAMDNLGAWDSAAVNVVVRAGQSCAEAGNILREVWTGIRGTSISSIPVNSPPSSTGILTIFEGPSNVGNNYGSRIRGYLCVPESGNYTFWISSNEKSELWLSTDVDPDNKVKIAYVNRSTSSRQWNKFRGQKSVAINLLSGQQYYIEALQKEGAGKDHIAVGWRLPDGSLERPIPGIRLLPFLSSDNEVPMVSITSPANGETYSSPAKVIITADASDGDGSIAKVEFYNGTAKLGEDIIAPYSFTWYNVSAGNYSLMAKATDNQASSKTSAPVYISVNDICMASGTITREYWSGIKGNKVSAIPLKKRPARTNELTIFEGPSNIGKNYGTRISGYICPPATGNYTFWISSNDHSELWLSIDDNSRNKVKIASISGTTAIRQWDKYTSQRSATIPLTEGKKYYIEALHKQGKGEDNIAVGWQLPDGVMERPIPGNRLSPVNKAGSPFVNQLTDSMTFMEDNDEKQSGMDITVFPNPAHRGTITLVIEGYKGTERTTDEAHVDIRNITGLSVYSNKLLCKDDCITVIDVNKNFATGVYIIHVIINKKTFSKKLVIH